MIIVAPATSPGRSAIHIVRVSGDGSHDLVRKFLPGLPGNLQYRYLYRGRFFDEKTVLDDVLVAFYQSPQTYTGEDMVEIFCHGNPVILERISDLLTNDEDARLAFPGEFTRRALMNGKLDLSQAEAVESIVRAPTVEAVKTALRSLEGETGVRVKEIMALILDTRARIEADLDFPEDDVPAPQKREISLALSTIRDDLESVLARAEKTEKFFNGVTIAIAGLPNVGKSSLLNRLSGRERAIVHHEPGTTRDYVETIVEFSGIPARIVDTAGVRADAGSVESIGISKSREIISKADIVIHLLDAVQGETEGDGELAALAEGRDCIKVWNKIDLLDERLPGNYLGISCLTGENVEELRNRLEKILCSDRERDVEKSFFVSNRQRKLLEKALESIERSEKVWREAEQEEVVVAELVRQAGDHLSELTGQDVTEETLDRIFSRFCIGK